MRLREQWCAAGIPMEALYRHLDLTRQSIHKRLQAHRNMDALRAAIEAEVLAYRKCKDHRAGSRSLYYNLEIKGKYGIGVSKFERLMSTWSFTLKPLRVRQVTTVSCAQSWNYSNLVTGLEINDINQVVVGDITYLTIGGERFYLFCLTDIYSARLVGLYASDRIRSLDAGEALSAMIQLRGPGNLEGCIHHTDGGGQYFSNEYLGRLGELKIRISVARSCQENGFAEQRNGLIKHHLLPTKCMSSLRELQSALVEIEEIYNCERKQSALGWRTPVAYEQYIKSLSPSQRQELKLHSFEDPSTEGFSKA